MGDSNENVPDTSSDMDVGDVDDENLSTLLYVNRFIPQSERDAIPAETKDTEEELIRAVYNVKDELATAEEVSVKTIGRMIKLINTRLSLKYYFSVRNFSLQSIACRRFICSRLDMD